MRRAIERVTQYVIELLQGSGVPEKCLQGQRRWNKIRGSEEITHLLNGEVYKDGALIQSPMTGQRGAA